MKFKRLDLYVFFLLAVFSSSFMTIAAFADPTNGIPGAPAHWYTPLLEGMIPVILALLTALGAWLSKKAAEWVHHTTEETKTGQYAVWYSTALKLAGIAVKYAETKFGPDSGTGEKKRAEAVAWLKARLLALDPTMKINDSDIAAFVDAAYHDIFAVVSPLGGSPALAVTPKP